MISPAVKKKREYLFIFFIYLVITVLIFWQRSSHFFTHYGMPDIDSDGTMWYLWAKIFSQQHSFYFNLNNSLFGFPTGYDYSSIPLFSLIYEIGIYLARLAGGAWSDILAFANFSTLIAYPLSAFSGFLLAYYLVRDKYAAFVAGLIFSFSYYHIMMGRGFMSTNHVEFVPLYFLSLFYALDKKTLSAIIISGLTLSLTFMSNVYLAFFCGLFSIFFILLYRADTFQEKAKIVVKYYGIVFTILLLTNINYFISQRLVFNRQNFVTIGRNFIAEDQTVRVISFFTPSQGNWLYPFSNSGNNFMGYAALGLGLVGLYLLKKNKLYFLLFVSFLISVLLASNIPGLFFINKIYFRIFGMFRAVSRLNILSSLFLSLMAAMVINYFSQRYLWSPQEKK
jgi:hypothetical protein